MKNVITPTGLIGTLILMLRRGTPPQLLPLKKVLLWLWSVCGLVVLGFVRHKLVVRQPQGCYLFTALLALAILVALGYPRLSDCHFRLVGSGIVLLTFVVRLICVLGTMLPAYALPA